jgi:hypothetical protein
MGIKRNRLIIPGAGFVQIMQYAGAGDSESGSPQLEERDGSLALFGFSLERR